MCKQSVSCQEYPESYYCGVRIIPHNKDQSEPNNHGRTDFPKMALKIVIEKTKETRSTPTRTIRRLKQRSNGSATDDDGLSNLKFGCHKQIQKQIEQTQQQAV